MARSAFEYDGELAVNLLLEAKEDLLEISHSFLTMTSGENHSMPSSCG